MHAGVLGVAQDDFAVVQSFSNSVRKDDRELTRCLEVDRVFSLPSGTAAFEGRAAVERPTTRTATEIDAGEIRVRESTSTETVSTAVAGVPGEFVVVENGRGTFAFEMVEWETGTGIERAELDLNAVLDSQKAAKPWKAGFYDTDGNCENGVLHGSDLLADENLGAVVEGARLNQLGLDCEYEDHDLKMTASESGYVEIYQPGDFETAEFLQYLRDEIVPHVT
ncbi:hypothetical protein [Halorussus halophilus]|uniref:hypothetical protein n=1 Tax=Halorussus halophilus TaxID=2650975 RepID=UPI001300CEE9|nr:hypothetical protein [Halorussus halophilus]